MGSTKHNTLKRDPYDNCKVRGKDGAVMFYGSKKRCNWYLSRGLAVIISSEPTLEIQLTFETKGPGNKFDDYYMQQMVNICVVCGSKDNLTKHHIVPRCFRDWMPDEIKNHSYHDVLLLCSEDHERYEEHALELKKKIAHEYKAPINGIWVSSEEEYIAKHKAVSIAKTLLKHANKIPNERKIYLIEKIKESLGINEVDLEVIAGMKFDSPAVQSLGAIVVSRLTNLEAFLIMWREHFVSSMSPQCLPKNWRADRKGR